MRSLLEFHPTRRGREDVCGASLLPSTVPPAHTAKTCGFPERLEMRDRRGACLSFSPPTRTSDCRCLHAALFVVGRGACQLSSLILLQVLGEDREKVGDGSSPDQVSSYLHSSLLQPFECLGTSPRVVNCVSTS